LRAGGALVAPLKSIRCSSTVAREVPPYPLFINEARVDNNKVISHFVSLFSSPEITS